MTTTHGKLVLLIAATLASCSGCNSADSGNVLEGAGSSFVNHMMQQWTTDYEEAKGVHINYQSVGSGAGIDKMSEEKVDFGCTDAPMSPDQLRKARNINGEVVHIPLCMGALVPAYNLDGNPKVKFTGAILARIYLGSIRRWDDPELQAIQDEGVKLPPLDIVPVARADGSGSSYIFSDYLQKCVGDKWTPGVGLNPEFGKHVKEEQKTHGIAGFIKATKGALGYVEMLYALQTKIPYGLVQNKQGKFVAANVASVTAAAASVADKEITENFSITNAPGEDAYPISGVVWAVFYANQEPEKRKSLLNFIRWATHDGQGYCAKLYYAPLPANVVTRIDAKLASLESK